MTYENGEIKESYDVPLSNKSSMGTWVIRHRKEYYTGYLSHLVLDDFEPLHKNFKNISVPYETIYYAPLIVDEKVIGVFSLQRYTINGYDHAQIEMMRALSSYIAIAIANALKTAQMKELNDRLKTISKRDGLSGLYNRYALNEDVGIILNAFNNENRSLSTLMCDIDFFKEYNDFYGHLEGDKVIKTIAQVLKDTCEQSTSYIYRYGGDEFMVVFLDIDEDEVAAIAQKILKAVSESNMPHIEKGINEKVSVSIGLAYFEMNKEILNEDDLLRSADISLYISKRKGRNQARSMKF
jgi:diguanylate cyclase (GGDEF)-like protein